MKTSQYEGKLCNDVELRMRRFSPNECELEVKLAIPANQQPPLRESLSISGRLTGPTCPYSSTIEIAYRVRATSESEFSVGGRVFIPEPSFWDPTAPFLYHSAFAILDGETPIVLPESRHGLRTCRFHDRVLLWNGQPLRLNGVRTDRLDSAAARSLHDQGVNLIVAPPQVDLKAMCSIADEYGLIVIAESDGGDLKSKWRLMRSHCSFLGWTLVAPIQHANSDVAELRGQGQLFGTTIADDLHHPLIDFVTCRTQEIEEFTAANLPLIVENTAGVDLSKRDVVGEFS